MDLRLKTRDKCKLFTSAEAQNLSAPRCALIAGTKHQWPTICFGNPFSGLLMPFFKCIGCLGVQIIHAHNKVELWGLGETYFSYHAGAGKHKTISCFHAVNPSPWRGRPHGIDFSIWYGCPHMMEWVKGSLGFQMLLHLFSCRPRLHRPFLSASIIGVCAISILYPICDAENSNSPTYFFL